MECRLTHRVHGQLAINASAPTAPAANAKTPYAANGGLRRRHGHPPARHGSQSALVRYGASVMVVGVPCHAILA